jgi:hypothetical protein
MELCVTVETLYLLPQSAVHRPQTITLLTLCVLCSHRQSAIITYDIQYQKLRGYYKRLAGAACAISACAHVILISDCRCAIGSHHQTS